MKQLMPLLLLGLMTTGFAQNDAAPFGKINIYYFHTSYRCTNCKHFDSWTQDVVEKRLKSLADTLSYQTINIEEEENKHFVDDYNLVTKSVILSTVDENGEELEWKNLDKIWIEVRDENKFKDYIESEIKSMLESVQ